MPKPLRLEFPATPEHVAPARRALTAYARDVGRVDAGAVELAASEAITNAVIHAYRDRDTPGHVSVAAEHPEDNGLVVTIEDAGCGLSPRHDSPGMGLGLALVARLAHSFQVGAPAGGGTRVCMSFARV
jgi:serine/threonine-protein kinase RsbW/stage II sporulation protein AB (anti-sigma F factor)